MSNDKVIKILYLHGTSEISGAEQSLLNLVRNMDRSAFEPVFILPEEGRLCVELRKSKVRIRLVKMPRIRSVFGVAGAIRELTGIVRSEGIRLIHSNNIRNHLYGAVAAGCCGIPVIWHERCMLTDEILDPDRLFSFLPDRIICNSRAIAGRFLKNGSLPAKVKVIYNGVDTKIFYPSSKGEKTRSELGIGPDEIVIGVASRFNRCKGHEVLFRAAELLLRGDAGIAGKLRFLVVGGPVFGKDTPREEYLIDLADELKIKDKVIFIGFREDMPEIYSMIDIFVLPSEADGCSRSLIEAMASGKALVATNSGGTPELVKDNETGFLIEPGDAEALADKIAILAADKDLAGRMGLAGRQRVEENFSIGKNVSGIQSVYLEVLAK